ncbi:hypothetical protein BD626DRAFT_212665 [Schizophyllum amplum]|uniref:F-box domain-containing protein n=1 Tax=Schizophyllum amplum TaxID=97359 RepID=A0A550BXV7_9AGAR|nr:hypothetical protein BD626DRAFT_212665 [Auriculariopsis ampla]
MTEILGLSSLPNELLIRISQEPHLNTRDLLNLCITNKRLLSLTVPSYLQRYGIACDASVVDVSGYTTAALHGLSLSTSLRALKRLRCVLNHGSQGVRLVRETRALARVVAILDHADDVDIDLSGFLCPQKAVDEWTALLGALLRDLVIGRKCSTLTVRRGGYVHASSEGGAQLWDARADEIVRMVSGMRDGPVKVPDESEKGTLRRLTIFGAPLLAQPPFMPFMDAALTSATLTHLTFDTLSLADPAWAPALAGIRLPSLTHLTLHACVLRFAALIRLLTTHAHSLQTLDLTDTTHPYGDAPAAEHVDMPVALRGLHTIMGLPSDPPVFAEHLLSDRPFSMPALAHLELVAAFGVAERQHVAPLNRILETLASAGAARRTSR